MHKRDYIAIAAIFRPFVVPLGTDEVDNLLTKVADYMEADNPLFNRALFLDAAGLNE